MAGELLGRAHLLRNGSDAPNRKRSLWRSWPPGRAPFAVPALRRCRRAGGARSARGRADRTVADPAGYLVVHADSRRRLLVIEHYRYDGLLTAAVGAAGATDGYTSVLAAGLVSRLDHAA
jgi:hypothetical protein